MQSCSRDHHTLTLTLFRSLHPQTGVSLLPGDPRLCSNGFRSVLAFHIPCFNHFDRSYFIAIRCPGYPFCQSDSVCRSARCASKGKNKKMHNLVIQDMQTWVAASFSSFLLLSFPVQAVSSFPFCPPRPSVFGDETTTKMLSIDRMSRLLFLELLSHTEYRTHRSFVS